MPILGKAGESLSTRLFGRSGLQEAGKAIVSGNLAAIYNRAKQGASTSGGFLGGSSKDRTNTSGVVQGESTGDSGGNSGGEPPSLKNLYGLATAGQNASNADAKAREMVGSAWKDSGDLIKGEKSSLATMAEEMKKLPTLRDRTKTSAKTYLDKANEAVSGNKTLIQKKQKEDLDKVAEDVSKNIFNTNINLGALRASNSSAAGRFAKVLGKQAGQQRKETLEGYGTQTAEQDQTAADELERYNLRLKEADDWYTENFKAAKAEYDRLNSRIKELASKADDWEKEDLKAASDKNLQKFAARIAEADGKMQTFAQNLREIAKEQGLRIDELESAQIDINTPAELQVPDYTDEWSIDGLDSGAVDWYDNTDPEKAPKDKKIIGHDIFGNPIYEETVAA
ncbi:MAG: hypothetical protein HGA33_03255 [Candidatus Moranbacteria bacterium]|nr:hypothetical protein [Candidatus Moranbacteria bacterium]